MKLIRLTAQQMLDKLPLARHPGIRTLVERHPDASDLVLWRMTLLTHSDWYCHLTGKLGKGHHNPGGLQIYPPVNPATNEWLDPPSSEVDRATHWTPASELRAHFAATSVGRTRIGSQL